VLEQYRIEFRDGCARHPQPQCHVPDLISDGTIDHDALAKWVTRGRNRTKLAADSRLPLAQLPVVDPHSAPRCHPGGVDIGVRPVLLGNLVLLEVILARVGAETQ
jgi:hypothetical protein